jgi:hypothetical protein
MRGIVGGEKNKGVSYKHKVNYEVGIHPRFSISVSKQRRTRPILSHEPLSRATPTQAVVYADFDMSAASAALPMMPDSLLNLAGNSFNPSHTTVESMDFILASRGSKSSGPA